MLVLLPPSEGKTRPSQRRGPVDLDRLTWPELTPARERVLAALAAVSARPDAGQVLGVGASLGEDVAANTRLRTAPAAPAAQVYSGVLFGSLGVATMTPRARRRALRHVVVLSALWGPLRLGDKVPAYRLSMSTSLPDVGPLAAYWRPLIEPPLTAAAGRGLVVDCRSSTYQAAWAPSGEVTARTVGVRVLREQDGRRTVVSHAAKHTRGLVARHLLELADEPGSPAALAAAVGEAFDCELRAPGGSGRAWTLDVLVRG